jgi:hypothetical protein
VTPRAGCGCGCACGGAESGSDGGPRGSQITESVPARPAGETVQTYLPETPVPVTPGDHPAYRPTTLDRGMASPIERIRWKAYGDSTAVGTCIADGKRVTIRLRALDVCNHKLTYMEWAIDRVGSRKKPPSSAPFWGPTLRSTFAIRS